MALSPMLMFRALQTTARMGTVLQILVFLPLTLATLSQSAFLSLSLLLAIHTTIHSTMNLLLPSLQASLPFLQVPLQPVFLLLIFNLYTAPWNALLSAASIWGTILRYGGPLFFVFEALATLIVVQSMARQASKLIDQHLDMEGLDFGILIGAAAAYVLSAWWIIASYPAAAASPLSSTLLGASIMALIFLTVIGFATRRSNVIESSGMALYLAYNVWLCSDRDELDKHWLDGASSYAPLLENLLPHLESLINFITHTIPKPTLISLLYRLGILHFASIVLPSIGADSWEFEEGVNNFWENRPSQRFTTILLAYRQTILIAVYSHLLMLDPSIQIWWRWSNIFFTLTVWTVEICLAGEGGGLGEKWKVE